MTSCRSRTAAVEVHRFPCRTLLVAVGATLLAGFNPIGAQASDLETISHGDRVALQSHLVTGKYTLFDFSADWCPGCRQLEPYVRGFASGYPDSLAVRKIDVGNWNSPVAQQYQVHSLPHLRLYDPDGQLLVQGSGQTVLTVLQQRLGGAPRAVPANNPPSSGTVVFLVLVTALAMAAILLYGSLRRPPQQSAADGRQSTLPPSGHDTER